METKLSHILRMIMQEQILIFRTSIKSKRDVRRVEVLFAQNPQISKWTVDFDDWEKILRVECRGISSADISNALRIIDIHAVELEEKEGINEDKLEEYEAL